MTLYFISGLGADKRVFDKLTLPEKYKVKHITWIAPIKNEPIEKYAKRLSTDIDSSEPFCLIGLSFGGIMAIEIAKILSPKQTIIISSVSNHKQLPWYFIIPKILNLHVLIPTKLLKSANAIAFWAFGVKSIEDQKLLKQILNDTDVHFLRWALSKIINWKNEIVIENLSQMHGSSDNIFPIRYIKPDKTIKNGGHFMVFNMASEISAILTEKLSKYP